ncbi:hypothetical protein D2E22_0209 [Bifidobacterium castoris]|uniref:Uncharacterized protein n=1 Tax=Bifidobacterium castoris TaxID=2306972 RepID=A0A430FAB4_9BIFI|nr:hypothetical protein D2E22_0209 [Bifidobacterium castoris]
MLLAAVLAIGAAGCAAGSDPGQAPTPDTATAEM